VVPNELYLPQDLIWMLNGSLEMLQKVVLMFVVNEKPSATINKTQE
jgi:hypothetical protein